jgi:hypothetical protein
MTKSHVSMEQHVCLVCGQTFDTGSILLDKRLRDSLEPKTVTGWDLCPEHKALYETGMVALVEVDEDKTGPRGATLRPEDAYRTGRVAHVKEEAFRKLFNISPRDERGKLRALMFIDKQAMDYITDVEKRTRP